MQTARFKNFDLTDSVVLLKDMPPLSMTPMEETPSELTLEVDTSQTFQEILGFGGAFTEASAINWRLLSKKDQEEVIRLYFAPPEQGGHGYTLGRVPMNSCDFSPKSYNFANKSGDMELEAFDKDVKHDYKVGMIPMIQQAQEMTAKRGFKLNVYASPWSPPAWMKLPAWGMQSMLLSDSPNGLMPSMQAPWAKYFSKFITAYKKHGIDLWGVTVQNEPEAAVGWEACLWTPKFMASFVRDYLGPTLEADHPEVKIIGYDHNKDHLPMWADGMYADDEAKKYLWGLGVHWYGGLNTKYLNYTHNLAPDKAILATEACNCGGVVFKDAVFADGNITQGTKFLPAWWGRAEALALDILEDLRYWAVGWTDWNLVLSPSGGPNHLKNLCDANIIADPEYLVPRVPGTPEAKSALIMQASYYFMGHFSRYFPPGSKRVHIENTVEASDNPTLMAGDVKNGQALLFAPCDGNDVQQWTYEKETGAIFVRGTDEAEGSDGFHHGGECMDKVDLDMMPSWALIPGKTQVWACNSTSSNQQYTVKEVSGGSQIVHLATSLCLTAVESSGVAVGLDQGVTIVAAQLKKCLADGAPAQTFKTLNADQQGFPTSFPVRTLPSAPGGGELCLQPQIVRMPHFDAVAFQDKEGGVAVVVMNVGDHPIDFTLVDKVAKHGVRDLTIPPHGIHTYRWKPNGAVKLDAVEAVPEGITTIQELHASDGAKPPKNNPTNSNTAEYGMFPGFADDDKDGKKYFAQNLAAHENTVQASSGSGLVSFLLYTACAAIIGAAWSLRHRLLGRERLMMSGDEGDWEDAQESSDYAAFLSPTVR